MSNKLFLINIRLSWFKVVTSGVLTPAKRTTFTRFPRCFSAAEDKLNLHHTTHLTHFDRSIQKKKIKVK